MNFKKIIMPLVAVLGFAMATSCNSDDKDACYITIIGDFKQVLGPETTTVNTPVTLQASFEVQNGCGEFKSFIESNGYPKTVRVETEYAGCVCDQGIKTLTEDYTFQASEAGEYQLKFSKGGGEYILWNITVTE